MTTRIDVAAIRARANAVDLPKVRAYGRMELTSPGVRRPLEWRRVVDTVDTLDAALEALSERMHDGRALCDRVEALETALVNARYALRLRSEVWPQLIADDLDAALGDEP